MSDTKEYIIDKAFELFLSKSYEAVSISDISQAIGLTKGALYHHFTNKEELFRAVIDKYLTFIGVEVDVEKVSLERYNELIVANVERMLNRLFSNETHFVPINYLTLIADGFRHYKGFAEEKEKFFNTEINKTKSVLESLVKRGEVRSDIDTMAIAKTYFSSTIGLAGNMLQNYSLEESLKSLKDQLSELAKLLKA